MAQKIRSLKCPGWEKKPCSSLFSLSISFYFLLWTLRDSLNWWKSYSKGFRVKILEADTFLLSLSFCILYIPFFIPSSFFLSCYNSYTTHNILLILSSSPLSSFEYLKWKQTWEWKERDFSFALSTGTTSTFPFIPIHFDPILFFFILILFYPKTQTFFPSFDSNPFRFHVFSLSHTL